MTWSPGGVGLGTNRPGRSGQWQAPVKGAKQKTGRIRSLSVSGVLPHACLQHCRSPPASGNLLLTNLGFGSICARHGAASRQCSFSSLDHAHWRTLELGSSRRCGESTLKNRVNARGRYKLQHKGGCSGGNGHSQANAMNFEKCIQPSDLPTTRKRTLTEIRCQKLVTRNLMARAPNDWRALRGIDPKRIAIAAFQCKADK